MTIKRLIIFLIKIESWGGHKNMTPTTLKAFFDDCEESRMPKDFLTDGQKKKLESYITDWDVKDE